MKKIPATIFTGFLGAGKTSIIRNLIMNNEGKKLAFLINEFGDLGIDKEMLTGCGMPDCTEEDIVELSNGCICCTVADDFLPTMEQILAKEPKPDHIIIETSGLALPKPLVKAFEWPTVKHQTTVDGVVAIVDSKALSEGKFAHNEELVQKQREDDENLDHVNSLHEVFNDQLVCADVVVLNKADLLEDSEVENLKNKLQDELRDGVNFVVSKDSSVDAKVLLGLNFASEDTIDEKLTKHEEHHHHHDHDHDDHDHHHHNHDHDHDDFESFTIEVGEVKDSDELQSKIISAVKECDILRVKGFIYNSEKERREVIQGVGPRFNRYFDREWKDSDKKTTTLVIIGKAHLDQEKITSIIKG